MVAAPGAEDVLRHCGGLRTVLTAISFDFGLALPQPDQQADHALERDQRQAAGAQPSQDEAEAAGHTALAAAEAGIAAADVRNAAADAPRVADAGAAGRGAEAEAAAVGREVSPSAAEPAAAQHGAQPAAVAGSISVADSMLFRLDDYEQVLSMLWRYAFLTTAVPASSRTLQQHHVTHTAQAHADISPDMFLILSIVDRCETLWHAAASRAWRCWATDGASSRLPHLRPTGGLEPLRGY